jgi:hypothetical protein
MTGMIMTLLQIKNPVLNMRRTSILGPDISKLSGFKKKDVMKGFGDALSDVSGSTFSR